MRELFFEKSQDFSLAYQIVEDQIGGVAYKKIARVFSENIIRVRAMGMSTLNVIYFSTLMSMAMTAAQFRIGRAVPNPYEDPEIKGAITLFLENVAQRNEGRNPEDIFKEVIDTSGYNLRSLIVGDESGQIASGHEAIMSAMIVESWSSFEALAIDLWVAALNQHPALGAAFAKKNGEKSITFDQLRYFGFDISIRMGDALKFSSKVKFDSLADIEDVYRKTFSEDIKKIFDGDRSLAVAEKVRHLIAYRSGIVDERFMRLSDTVITFPSIQHGARLQIDGNIVCSLVSACVNAGVDLLKYVDKYTQTNC